MSKFVDTQSVSIGAVTEEVLRETILPMVARLRG